MVQTTHVQTYVFLNIQPLHNIRSTQLCPRGQKSLKGAQDGPNLPHIQKSECNPRPLTNIRVTGLHQGYGQTTHIQTYVFLNIQPLHNVRCPGSE